APNDVLWFLGDWSFGGEPRINELRNALRVGDIHFILGNHDHHIAKDPQKYRFHSVRHYAELTLPGKVNVVLCHYPIESWVNMERGAIHLHGHCHGKLRHMAGRYDVGLDALGIISADDVAK